MAPIIFFSYTHVDEKYRDQLETQLSALKRQNLISAWHDRRIVAGSHVDDTISEHLEEAQIILLLISADFIGSDYCYEREMKRSMEKHEAGEARVIPVIVRPCDWHDLPLGKLMASPKDGKPISTWADIDEAFLDVVRSIKTALKELSPTIKSSKPSATRVSSPSSTSSDSWVPGVADVLGGPRSSNLRIKKEFTDLDRDRFRREGFDIIARYFENSMLELVKRNPGVNLEQHFERIDTNRFTAAVYKSGRKVCQGSASISNGHFGRDAIQYSMDDDPRSNSANEILNVKADDQILYFEPMGMQNYGRNKAKLSAQGAAETFWELFINPLQ